MVKKIRILQFPIAASKGGITQYILRNWEFIDKSKFQFDFATMSKSLSFADKLEKDECKIHYISSNAETDKKQFIDNFTKILLHGNYDIVQLHTKQWKSCLIEQIAKKVGIKKVIIHAHNTGIDTLDEEKRKSEILLHNQVLEQLTENIATDYWACSWKAAEFIFGNKIPKYKIKIMNNAVDLSKHAYNQQIRKEYREKLGITDNEIVIGNIGRFTYQKNQEFLIDVFCKICSNESLEGCKYKLFLIGNGEREDEYKKLVRKNTLENKVVFLGYREDVAELLQAMDVFCLPSRFEGLPISMIEAQASGLPCIISDLITNEVIINDNVMRIPLDVKLWENKIRECGDRTYNRKNGKQKLMQRGYDLINQIKKIEKEYVI